MLRVIFCSLQSSEHAFLAVSPTKAGFFRYDTTPETARNSITSFNLEPMDTEAREAFSLTL